MDRRAAWVLGLIFGGLFLCLFGFLLILFIAVQAGEDGISSGKDKVGVVEVLGVIDGETAKRVVKELDAFRDTDHIKAIVVRVDSPGGEVAPSQEIYDAIRRINPRKKIFVSMGSMAASGGFYVASAAEKVYANPGTLTGSVGVIMQMPNVRGLLKWAGVEVNTVTSGKMKDVGSPFREMTAEEREYFRDLLGDVHEQFIAAVAQGRGLEVEAVRPYADGRVFTGRQAKEWKLVDELGGLSEAVAAVGKLAGIEGDPEVEYPRQKTSMLKELMGGDVKTAFRGAAARVFEDLGEVSLQYRIPALGDR